mmetsp:Transcript_107329/g.256331  ORF Transcript_107329/g.256331 Transcript_107329/m.256331 type:complete len:545 (+) Transcript_107329:113-1747(+)
MKLLQRSNTAVELLQLPKPLASPARTRHSGSLTPTGFRRRSVSQDETHKVKAGLWRSLSSTQSPSHGSLSSSRADSELDFGMRPLALTTRGEGLDCISSQPGSVLPSYVLDQCLQAAPGEFRSKLSVALQYFSFFRDLKPQVFTDLLGCATVEDFPAGRVLFKQGDPSGACYLLLSGHVGLYMESQGLGPELPKRPLRQPKQRRRSKSLFATEPFREMAEPSACQTAEGYGYLAEDSLGRFCDSLGCGKLFGEIGLQGEKRRAVSAKCLEDTVCVVIRKSFFVKAKKEEAKRIEEERLAFLEEHLPGMREAASEKSKKDKSGISFKQAVYSKGHVFLKQGETAEEITYIVMNGCVEFQRCELLAPPPSILAPSGPGSRQAWVEDASPGFGKEEKTVTSEGQTRRREITRRIGSLTRGGVFGSLSGLGEVEPFTVVAESAQVEVLYISSDAKQKLPRVVAEMLKEYISRSTTWRLQNLRMNRSIDQKRTQTRVAPSFPLLGSLFPTPSKDWATMSKVSHTEPQKEAERRSHARARLVSNKDARAV